MGKIIIEAADKTDLLSTLSAFGLFMAVGAAGPNTGAHVTSLPATPASQDDEEDDAATAGPVPDADPTGLPWDARIHSDKKGRNKDGSWRSRRNVDEAFVKQVEAELRGRNARIEASPPAIPAQPAAYDGPSFPPPMPGSTQPAPTPPPMAQVAQPQPEAAPAGLDFGGFMQKAALGMQTPGADGQPLLNTTFLAGVLYPAFGITNLGDLATRTDLIPQVVQFLQTQGRWPA